MKILSIHFKNINSLEGENRINFDQPPFVDAGVFAITGPNGSGKTSILDAITLGLYGETFKFRRPSENVMTKHTTECFSEVVFSVVEKNKNGGENEKQYCSSWRASREDMKLEDGSIQAKMQLIHLNGSEEILENETNKVREMIVQLTGMDFRNFTRSIMLAQGDSAAFLNALNNERLDILEKIISPDIYADFKKEIEEKLEIATIRLEQIQEEIAAIQAQVMDPIKLEACEHDLIDFEEQLADLKQKLADLKQKLEWLNKLEELEDRVSILKQNIQEAEKQAEQLRADLKRIAESQDVLEFKPDVDRIDEKEKIAKQYRQDLEAYRNDVIQLQEILEEMGGEEPGPIVDAGKSIEEQKKSIEEQKEKLKLQLEQAKLDKQLETALLQALENQIQEKQSELETVSAWLKEHESEQILLDDFPDIIGYKNLKAELKVLQAEHKSLVNWNKNAIYTRDKNLSELIRANKRIPKLNRKLKRKENELEALAPGKTLEDLVDVRKDQQERTQYFIELLNRTIVYKKLQSKWDKSIDLSLEVLIDEFAVLSDELNKEKNKKTNLDQAVTNETLLKKFQQDREALVEGEPCPLCGSLQHPYVEKRPKPEDSTQALVDQKSKVQRLQTKVDRIKRQIEVAQQKKQENAKIKKQLEEIHSKWSTLCNRLNIVREELTIDNVRLIKKLLGKEQSELESIIATENKFRGIKMQIEKIKFQIKNYEETIRQLKAKNEELDQELKKRVQKLKDLEPELIRCQQQLKELTDRLIGQLTRLNEKMPIRGREGALLDRLNTRRQEYQTYFERRKELQKEIEKLTEKVSECRAKSNELDLLIERINKQLKDLEVAGLHLALAEIQKLIADKKKSLAVLEKELDILQQALQERAAATKYKTVAQLRETLVLVLSQPQLEQKLAELEIKIENLLIELNLARSQLEAERAKAKTKLTKEEIEIRIREISEKMEIIAPEITRLDNIIKEQEALKARLDKLNQELEEQQQIINESEALLELIKVNDASLRRKLQREKADDLLSRANRYLETISGRYLLYQGKSEQGLLLEIEDKFQNNCRRLPKTLSGGESFVVSLALALALSEMANNGNSIDSLFLDEGFGSLDEESLYLVVSTLISLKSLQQYGKMVGVISHVKGVKERFYTQIEMSKKPNGLSNFAVLP